MTDNTARFAIPQTLPHPAPPTTSYDAIVVGSRVAGAATAMLLARQGLRVVMLDKRRPGSDTLSTHALMRGGVLQLQRWGLLDRVRAAGTPAIRQTTIHYGEAVDTIPIKPKSGVPALFAPRRTVLDSILVDAAVEAGVDARFGVSVDGLLRDETGRVRGVRGRDASGAGFDVEAPITVGADGRHSIVARDARAPVVRRGKGAGATIYSYLSGVAVDGYEWFYRPGVTAGLIPTNDGQICAWVGLPAQDLTRNMIQDLEGTFHRLLQRAAPEVAPRFVDGQRHGRLFAFPGQPGFQRRPVGPGWALVGDASHFKDPLSTHGITDALRDAEFLTHAICDSLSGQVPEAQAFGAYHATRDQLSDDLFTVTDVLAAYGWELSEMRSLLLALATAMKEEVEVLSRLDRRSNRTAA